MLSKLNVKRSMLGEGEGEGEGGGLCSCSLLAVVVFIGSACSSYRSPCTPKRAITTRSIERARLSRCRCRCRCRYRSGCRRTGT